MQLFHIRAYHQISWNFGTQATWWEELTHLKRPWCWKRLRAGGEGDDRGWDGWMASLTQWTWVWVDSESWWWTGKPGVLRFMGSQRVRHDWATELNWTELIECRGHSFTSQLSKGIFEPSEFSHYVCNVSNYIEATISLIVPYHTQLQWAADAFSILPKYHLAQGHEFIRYIFYLPSYYR